MRDVARGVPCDNSPSSDADFTCDTVTVEATSGLVEGCPVTATLSFENDCAESRTVRLTTSDTSDEFDISARCDCAPEQVTFEDAESGRQLGDPMEAPERNCVCENFDVVCEIEDAELEGSCAGDDVTVDCDGGAITFEGGDADDALAAVHRAGDAGAVRAVVLVVVSVVATVRDRTRLDG